MGAGAEAREQRRVLEQAMEDSSLRCEPGKWGREGQQRVVRSGTYWKMKQLVSRLLLNIKFKVKKRVKDVSWVLFFPQQLGKW